MSVSTIELSDRECGKGCIADDQPVCFGPIIHDVHTIDTTQEVPRYHLMKVSGRATSSSGSTFGRNTPNQLDQCSRSHRCGESKANLRVPITPAITGPECRPTLIVNGTGSRDRNRPVAAIVSRANFAAIRP